MKRLIQFVAVAVIGLMSAAPALTGLSCATGVRASCTAICPMAMSGMSADCPMTGQTATGDCPQNCCASGIFQALVSAAAPEKLRLAAGVSPSVATAEISVPGQTLAIHAPDEARAVSPPPYLLNRVFRI